MNQAQIPDERSAIRKLSQILTEQDLEPNNFDTDPKSGIKYFYYIEQLNNQIEDEFKRINNNTPESDPLVIPELSPKNLKDPSAGNFFNNIPEEDDWNINENEKKSNDAMNFETSNDFDFISEDDLDIAIIENEEKLSLIRKNVPNLIKINYDDKYIETYFIYMISNEKLCYLPNMPHDKNVFFEMLKTKLKTNYKKYGIVLDDSISVNYEQGVFFREQDKKTLRNFYGLWERILQIVCSHKFHNCCKEKDLYVEAICKNVKSFIRY